MTKNFIIEEKKLLKNFIHTFLSNPLTNDPGAYSLAPDKKYFAQGIELIIRPQCNQKCEYCYITQHGKELYPIEERISNEEILKNVKILLEYVYDENNYPVNHFELFAGDLFYDDLYFDILDIFYPYIEKLNKKYAHILTEEPGVIITPSNCYYLITDEKKQARFREYYYKFKEQNCLLIMSWSTDGKYATKAREKKELSDDFWDKGFSFIKEFNFGIHPMFSYENVDTAIENYDWMKEQIQKYELINVNQPVYLTVRNSGWNDNSIQKYLEFLAYVIEDRLKQCNNNIEEFAYHLFVGDGENNSLKRFHEFDPISLDIAHGRNYDQLTCSIQNTLHINISNMQIVPCHRLTYPMFAGGQIEIKNDKISDITPKNISTFLSILFTKNSSLPLCYECEYTKFCSKGCLGAQYEYSGELMLPIPDVCRMKKAVIAFLIKTYNEMGVFSCAAKLPELADDEGFAEFINGLKEYGLRRGVEIIL